ncbi:MAG: hypothetical protein ACT4PO_10845 [Actinomycetota bacterium]
MGDRYHILTPVDWTLVRRPSYGAEFAVASYRIGRGGDCMPTRALRALPPAGALFWVSEIYSPRDPGAFLEHDRPFGLGDLAPATDRCSEGTGASVIRFQEADRFIRARIVFGGEAPGSIRQTTLATLSSIVVNRCPGSPHDWSSINVDHGAAGDTVTVFGPTLRGEDGFYYPATGIELWWNERIDHLDEETVAPVEGLQPFAVAELDGGRLRGVCDYELKFKVPELRPDLYPVAVRVYHDRGYGWIGRFTFEVTRREQVEIASPPARRQVTRGQLPWQLAAVAGAGGAILTLLAVSVVAAARERRETDP